MQTAALFSGLRCAAASFPLSAASGPCQPALLLAASRLLRTAGFSTSAPASSAPGGDQGAAGASHLHVTVEPLSAPHEGVSVISLTRPDARNAIGRQLLRELAEALDTVRQERSTRCVLIKSGVPGGCRCIRGLALCGGGIVHERLYVGTLYRQGHAASERGARWVADVVRGAGKKSLIGTGTGG